MGTPGFGQAGGLSSFGQSSMSIFGQQTTPSLFGHPQQSASQPAQSAFGQSPAFAQSQPSMFGQPQAQAQASPFGQSFGQQSPPGSLFGTPQPQPKPQRALFQTPHLTTTMFQMAPVAPLVIPLPDREVQAFVDAYEDEPGNPKYGFKHLLLSLTDFSARMKPVGVSDIMWAEAMNKLDDMESADRERLWPEVVDGFKDLSKRLKLQDDVIAADVPLCTTGVALCGPLVERFVAGTNVQRASGSLFLPPPQSSSSTVRLLAWRRMQRPQSWHGRKQLVITRASADGVDGATTEGLSLTTTDKLTKEVTEDLRGDVNSGPEVPSILGSEPISLAIGESETPTLSVDQRWTAVKKKLGLVISNAQKRSQGLHQIRHSLGVDLGDSRTGVAISLKGYAPRPLSVLHSKGDKLIENLLQIAFKERADEFIVGLPTSVEGNENVQSNKTRSFAGKLASHAAQRGWRVYLMDEYGSSKDGLAYMLEIGIKKRSRKEKVDAYAALVLLHSYFNSEGARVKLVVPKGLPHQERLCLGETSIIDDFD